MDWKMYLVLMTVDNIYRIPEASLLPIRGGVEKKATYVRSPINNSVTDIIVAGNGRVPKPNLNHALLHQKETKNNEELSVEASLPDVKVVNYEKKLRVDYVTKTDGLNNDVQVKQIEDGDIDIAEAKSSELDRTESKNLMNTGRKRLARIPFRTRGNELGNVRGDDIYATRAMLLGDLVRGKKERMTKDEAGSKQEARNLVAANLYGEDVKAFLEKQQKTSLTKGVGFGDKVHHLREEERGSGHQDATHFELENILNLIQDSRLIKRTNRQKTVATHLIGEGEIFGDTNDGLSGEKEVENDNSRQKLHSDVTVQRAEKQGKSMEKEKAGDIKNIVTARVSIKHHEESLKSNDDPLSSSDDKQTNSVEEARELEESIGSGDGRMNSENMQQNNNSDNLTRNSGAPAKLPNALLSESIGRTTQTESDGEGTTKTKNATAAMRNNDNQEAKNSNPEQGSEIGNEQGTTAAIMDNNEDQFGSGQKGIEAYNGIEEHAVESKKVENTGGFQSTDDVNMTTKAESLEKEISEEIGPKESRSRHELINSKLKGIEDRGKASIEQMQGSTTSETKDEHGRFGSGEGEMNDRKSDKNRNLKIKTENSEQTEKRLEGKIRSGDSGSDKDENDAEEEEITGDDDFDTTNDEAPSEKLRGAHERLDTVHLERTTEAKETGRENEDGQDDQDDEEEERERDEKKLEEFLGLAAHLSSKSEKTKDESGSSGGIPLSGIDEDWELQGLRQRRIKAMKKAGKDGQRFDTKAEGEDKEVADGTPDREYDRTRTKDRDFMKDNCTTQENQDRQRNIMTQLEDFMKDDNCTTQENQDRQRNIMTQLEDFMKDDNCTTQENQDRQRNIMTQLEDFMKDDNCTTQENQDRQRNIMTQLEDFMKDDNCTTQENQDRQRNIMTQLEDFMKDDNCTTQENQLNRQRNIMTHLEDFMKEVNCTTKESQDRQRKIMSHLEDFMKEVNCTTKESQDRQRKIMSHLEDFMKDDNSTTQVDHDRQRNIMTRLEDFMKHVNSTTQENQDFEDFESLPKRGRGRATYDPVKILTDVHKMERELLQAQREANNELEEVQFELGRKLSGLEINLGMVIQLANAMDQKIGSAVENALEMTDEAGARARNKLAQVREAASAVEVIERKVGAAHTLNASRVLLSRLPENPNFKSNKLYRQLLATNALITKLKGAKILAESRAEKSFEGEENTGKVIENEAEMIREELASAEVELRENTAKELDEEREAKAKIREAERKNAETYQRASQALTKVDKYLAKLEKDETKLSKY